MGKPVEKKKGRPSLVDLRKRSLRLQKLQEQKKKKRSPNPNPNPNAIPNPYARFPFPSAGRLSSRRNPDPEPKSASPAEDGDDTEAEASMEEDEDDDEPKERRKEKKLKLVLHLPHPNTNSSDLASYAPESNGTVPENRKIDTLGKPEGKNSAWKATEPPQGTSDLGPTTPLPDKKILDFILDRLQKKDIYGVFSEPVDPEELPDYHDIIKHPMDFGTVRKRLSSGAYKDLEQFEKDVFLISSNAMRYNAPDTIYFRQARSIHELATRSFENLRHGGDGSEQEPKIVRRGRPPGTGKNSFKRPVGRPPVERSGSEFSSEASLANAFNGIHSSGLKNDLLGKGLGLDRQRIADASVRPTQFIYSPDAYIFGSELRSARNEDCSGKGFSNYGKKPSAMDESRRNTYKQSLLSSSLHECSVLAALDGERKILLQVGLNAEEHAYARSLARFAAHLGPIGWNIAAKRIEKVLPSGTKFGPAWVGENENENENDARQSYPLQVPKPSSPHPSSMQPSISAASRADQCSKRQEEHPSNNLAGLDPRSGDGAHQRFHDSGEAKGSSQLHHNRTMQPLPNGFKVPSVPDAARGNSGLEAVVAQAYAASTVSGHECRDEQRAAKTEVSTAQVTNHLISLPSSMDPQKPDLALQL